MDTRTKIKVNVGRSALASRFGEKKVPGVWRNSVFAMPILNKMILSIHSLTFFVAGVLSSGSGTLRFRTRGFSAGL
jgi:hypothetical protein